MGLFDKKYCDICGDKIGFLGNRKLEDGNLCKNCARKLSPFFTDRRRSTVEDIRAQLAYREENRKNLDSFHPDLVFGTDEKVYLDLTAKKLIITDADDFREDNPDIIDASQIISCEKHIEDEKEEIFYKDREGNEKSYNPPRYSHSYEFHLELKVDSPWFDDISVDLNDGERPDDAESDLYLEQNMKMSELYTIIFRWMHPDHLADPLMGPDVYISNLQNNAAPMEPITEAEASAADTSVGVWICACGTESSGNFCQNCGSRRPVSDEWKCSCGAVNKGKFCSECGSPRP